MKRIQIILGGVVVLVIGVWALWVAVKWTAMRVYVPQDKALVVINKFGQSLPPERIVVPAEDNQYKGIQEEVRSPGRYFINPVEYETQLIDLIEIPAGDPEKWDFDPKGILKDLNTAPRIGLLTMKEGKTPPPGQEVVAPGYKGIQQEVLTPGTYKINTYQKEVQVLPAVVVPPGSVGVVTRLVGERGEVVNATLTEIRASASGPSASGSNPSTMPSAPSRLVVGPTQRGILRDVLQPGIYYINPRMAKVTIVPVGYDVVTMDHREKTGVSFYSSDGYLVEADFTVVWGRSPADAPNIVANIGNIDRVEQNVIEPAMKAACQNEGATQTAIELIQGQTRSVFQEKLHKSLEGQVSPRNIHVLLVLIRNIAIKDKSGQDATEGLLATIQRANIEIEKDLTNKQKTMTAAVAAELEQAKKLVDVARETVSAESNVKVAGIMAEGQKQAAQIDAQRELDVASIQLQVAQLDAKRQLIMGKAEADVERMKKEAEAKGAKMLVDALGSPGAYNQYIFAKNFQPTELRLIFAGPGTFWTDLKSFEQIGASRMIQGNAGTGGGEDKVTR